MVNRGKDIDRRDLGPIENQPGVSSLLLESGVLIIDAHEHRVAQWSGLKFRLCLVVQSDRIDRFVIHLRVSVEGPVIGLKIKWQDLIEIAVHMHVSEVLPHGPDVVEPMFCLKSQRVLRAVNFVEIGITRVEACWYLPVRIRQDGSNRGARSYTARCWGHVGS